VAQEEDAAKAALGLNGSLGREPRGCQLDFRNFKKFLLTASPGAAYDLNRNRALKSRRVLK
jgi:hypothetical protein